MVTPIRIDGPVKISPDCRIDLAQYLNEFDHSKRGFNIDFKVAGVQTTDDLYEVEDSTVHRICSKSGFGSSFTFETEPCVIRHIDFALSSGNALFILAIDATVKAVLLEYVDITPT